MSTRVISASTRYASEAARDAASGWDEGDVVYVTGVGYTVFDGSEWAGLGGGGGGVTVDNGTDPPAVVTTIVAPWAIFDDPTTANFPLLAEVERDGASIEAGVSLTSQNSGSVTYAVDAYTEASVVVSGTQSEGAIAFTADQMGFFGATPVAQPEVPATPTEQDIVDALVALGLVTQAAP